MKLTSFISKARSDFIYIVWMKVITVLLISGSLTLFAGCSEQNSAEADVAARAKTALSSAGTAMVKGDYQAAMDHLNTSLKLQPSPIAYATRALVYAQQNNFEAAEADLRMGRELDPEHEQLKTISEQIRDMKLLSNSQ